MFALVRAFVCALVHALELALISLSQSCTITLILAVVVPLASSFPALALVVALVAFAGALALVSSALLVPVALLALSFCSHSFRYFSFLPP